MNKEIRVFISSTFNDMHPERDYLVKRTFPRLRHLAAQRGVILTEVDLRWGITEAESKEGKTLGICLDEIINSRPFFIGLLGNRYGWAPRPDELGPEAIPDRYDWISEDLTDGMSITELEMQFGVLRNPQKIYANFHIRKGGVDDNPKQTRLKEAIRNQDRYKAEEYSDPEDLGNQVEANFKELLDTLFPEETNDNADSLRAMHIDYARIEAKNYLPDPRIISQIDRFLSEEGGDNNEGNRYLHITGDSGSGKSALLSYILTREEENGSWYVVPYFAGAGGQTDATSLAERIKTECEAAGPDKRVLVIIDDAAAITDADSNADTSWMSAIPQNAVLLVASATGHPVTELLHRDIPEEISVMPLLLSQQRQLAESYFKSYRKRLTEEDYQLIVHPSKLFDNTLAYITLLEELRCFGSFDRLPEYIAKIASFTSPESFYSFLLESKERFYASERHPDVVRTIMSLLVLSAGGLTESDLVAISGLPQMLVSQFLLGNTYLVKRHNGMLKVAHNRIADVVTERYALNTEEGADELREAIIDYFESEAVEERLRDIELPYQYWRMDLLDNLYLYISDYSYLKRCLDNSRYFFLRYWQTLLNYDPWLYRVDAYFDGTPEMPQLGENGDMLSEMGRDYFAELFTSLRSTNLLQFTNLLLVFLNSTQPIEMMCCRALNTISKEQTELREPWLSLLATIYGRQGHFDKALKLFVTALDSLPKKDMESGHTLLSNIAETYLTIGDVTHEKHYYERATEIQKEVLDYRIKRYGRLHKDVAVTMSNLASSLQETGRYDEAKRMLAESTEIYRQLSGEVDIDVAINISNECNLALERGDYEQALTLSRRLIEIINALPVPESQHLIEAYIQELKALSQLDRKEEMASEIEKCLECVRGTRVDLKKIQRLLYLTQEAQRIDEGRLSDKLRDALLGTGELNDSLTYNLRGKALGILGMPEEAIADYDMAVKLYEKEGRYKDAVSAAGAAAAMLSLAMRFEMATEWFERAFDLIDEYDIEPDGQMGITWQNYAVTLYNMHRVDDAIVAMRNACDIRQTLFGDEDEMLVNMYLPLLNKMEETANSLTLTDTSKLPPHKDIELFKTLIEDDEEAIENFALAHNYFSRGGISHSISLFKQLLSKLNAKGASAGAIAWTKRSLAYAYELEKTDNSIEKALMYYKEALEDVLSTSDYKLQEAVAHDYAEFLWNEEDYPEAIRIYTYQWAGAVKEVGFFDQRSMRCVGNMTAAMLKCADNVAELEFALHCGSLLIILADTAEDEEVRRWGGSLVGNALTSLGIDFDKYRLKPVTTIAKVMNYFLNNGLTTGAATTDMLYDTYGYHIDSELSVRDSFYRLYLESRLADALNIADAIDMIAYTINYMNDHEEESATEREFDRLYELMATACIECCDYRTAMDCYYEVEQRSPASAEGIIKCAFMNRDAELGETLLNYFGNSNSIVKLPPLSIILAKLTCGKELDTEERTYLTDFDIAKEPTGNLGCILLAMSRAGMVEAARKAYRQVTDESYNEPQRELQRLYALCTYLEDNNLMEEVEVYKEYASKLIAQLEGYAQQLFAEVFENF